MSSAELRGPIKSELEAPSSAWGSGKLILLGEHAVVYGEPAVAVALPRGLKVTLTPLGAPARRESSREGVSAPRPQPLSYDPSMEQTGEVERSVSIGEAERAALNQALARAVQWASARGVTLEAPHTWMIEGSLPFKVGLGSSAALSVATLRALAERCGRAPWSDAELFEGAMEMERVFHVAPSGLDHQVSIIGGALCYQRVDAGPTFDPVQLDQPLTLALTWTPREGSTADAVRGVAQRRSAEPERYARMVSEIGRLAVAGVEALRRGDLTALGSLLNQNHRVLEELGVSTPELNRRCASLREGGALGAKLSGAGHGGVCFGLFRDRAQAEAALRPLGESTWVTEVSASCVE